MKYFIALEAYVIVGMQLYHIGVMRFKLPRGRIAQCWIVALWPLYLGALL